MGSSGRRTLFRKYPNSPGRHFLRKSIKIGAEQKFSIKVISSSLSNFVFVSLRGVSLVAMRFLAALILIFKPLVAYEKEKSNTELFYDLMQGYDKNIRPFYLRKPVHVTIDIFVNSFGSIRADDMRFFETNFFIF